MIYKFEIFGTGVELPFAYRSRVDSGVKYQVREALKVWRSKSNYGFILIYGREDGESYNSYPSRVFKFDKSGLTEEIEVENWIEITNS